MVLIMGAICSLLVTHVLGQHLRLNQIDLFKCTNRFGSVVNTYVTKPYHSLTLSLPRSSIDDLVFSVFTSNFFKLSYKISLLKNRFVTLFFIRFS